MNVLIDDGTMRSIGDSIRGKTGESGGLLPGEMPEAIDGISTGTVKAHTKFTSFIRFDS